MAPLHALLQLATAAAAFAATCASAEPGRRAVLNLPTLGLRRGGRVAAAGVRGRGVPVGQRRRARGVLPRDAGLRRLQHARHHQGRRVARPRWRPRPANCTSPAHFRRGRPSLPHARRRPRSGRARGCDRSRATSPAAPPRPPRSRSRRASGSTSWTRRRRRFAPSWIGTRAWSCSTATPRPPRRQGHSCPGAPSPWPRCPRR